MIVAACAKKFAPKKIIISYQVVGVHIRFGEPWLELPTGTVTVMFTGELMTEAHMQPRARKENQSRQVGTAKSDMLKV